MAACQGAKSLRPARRLNWGVPWRIGLCGFVGDVSMSDLVTMDLSIKSCGHVEFWLRDRIHDSPSILGLGDLQAVMKEKPQSQGGRLDLLLTDPTDNSMFEVELQLGETDPSHIIRTIEY
jgi:hypothetical protein